MATSSEFESSPETTNACRACRLLLGPCTIQLRHVLRCHIRPKDLQNILLNLQDLPPLTSKQMNIVFPKSGRYIGNFNDMDISLLYILLRNICGIEEHKNGWGKAPKYDDNCLSANIERIHRERNECVHSSEFGLSNAKFNKMWSNVKFAVGNLDYFLNNGFYYYRNMEKMKFDTMDPVRDRHYIEKLRTQFEEDAATRALVQDLKCKVEMIDTDQIETKTQIQEISDEVSRLKVAAVPPNVKEVYVKDIIRWKKDDSVFHECHSFSTMLEKVMNQTHVTFVGGPGSGKTATARHIALILQQKGYQILPIKKIGKIEKYCDPENPQVFVIDDVVGVFGLERKKLKKLQDYQDRVIDPVMPMSKTLMTCREAVYRKTIRLSSFFKDEKNIVLLHSKDNALSNEDKKEILKIYKINVNLFYPACLESNTKMFPYLCKLLFTEKKFQDYGAGFFMNPVPCILEELTQMKNQNEIQYFSLVLCMMNENKLSEKILQEIEKESGSRKSEMKRKVQEKCRVKKVTDNFKIVDALSDLEGTYTQSREDNGTEYTFVHDSMFEIVASHFGCEFPELILQFMSSTYIANYVKLQEYQVQKSEAKTEQTSTNVNVNNESTKSFDLCIRLKEKHYPMLAERLFRDIENMELYDVFMNAVLKQSEVCNCFVECLKKMSYEEMKTVFLSAQKDVSKIVSKGESQSKNLERKREWHKQRVLMNERWTRGLTYCIRVISWVVYYGHSLILQYILDQTEFNKETDSQFFGISSEPQFRYRMKQEETDTELLDEAGIYCLLNFGSASEKETREDINLSEKNRLLLLSCYSGNLETVKILKKHVGKNAINMSLHWYDTPFTAACEGGHKNIVQLLLEAGADLNVQSVDETPLIAACKNGQTSVVKMLLEKHVDVNLQGQFDTPLIAACKGGYMSVVIEILKKGAKIDLQGQFDTPLTAACKGGHIGVVKILLEAGAGFNLKGRVDTPLTAACQGGHTIVVQELLKVGADKNQKGKFDTPLTEACKGGHIDVVKELIKYETNVNVKGKYYTPLKAACEGKNSNIVKKLLQAKASVNTQDNLGRTPLYLAVLNNNETVVSILMKYGADSSISNCNREKLSPLYIALFKNESEMVELLLQTESTDHLKKMKKHFIECLQNIRHIYVRTDSKDEMLLKSCGLLKYNKKVKDGTEIKENAVIEDKADEAEVKRDIEVRDIQDNGIDVKDNDVVKDNVVKNAPVVKDDAVVEDDTIINEDVVNYDAMKKDYVIVKDGKGVKCKWVWHMHRFGDLFETIRGGDCGILNHLLALGLDFNQWIQLLGGHYDAKPLLFVLIDIEHIKFRLEKVMAVLEAGADVSFRVRYREYDSVLDREGVTALERTRRLVCKFRKNDDWFDRYKVPAYERILNELKKRVRRYSY